MDNRRKLRGIIVGAGRAGTDLHFGAFQSAGAEICAFVDTVEGNAQMAANECGVPMAYSSLDKALDEERPDFVSICSPPKSHFRAAQLALKSGSHVLIEKPFTSTLREAKALKALSQKTRRYVSVVHNRRFWPGMIKAVELWRDGAIGEILHVERYMMMLHEKVRMMEKGHWAHEIPGGRLFEANPHNLYIIYQFLGKMDLIQILPEKKLNKWPHATISGFTALLRAPKGGTAQITMSLRLEESPHQQSAPQFGLIIGTRGTLFVDSADCLFYRDLKPAQTSQVGKKELIGFAKRKIKRLLGKYAGTFSKKSPEKSVRDSSQEHQYLVDRFLGYIDGRYKEPLIGWDEILETQRLNEKMGKAAEMILGKKLGAH